MQLCGLLVLWATSLRPLIARQLYLESARQDDRTSVFVAVFSRRKSIWRRDKVRAMWAHAQKLSGDDVIVKFALCRDGGGKEEKWIGQSLSKELTKGDIAMIDCIEGSGRGAMTRKLLATMDMYTQHIRSDYFMKIDDDTFISWRRYMQWLHAKAHPSLYMGVEVGEAKPCRDQMYLGYEPIETFSEEVLPKSMSAGSGYTLSRDLVDTIVKTDLGKSNVLYNEDKSVGLWLQMIESSGRGVSHVGLPGVSGFWDWDSDHPMEAFTTLGDYGNVVHHGLEAETIECLSALDRAGDDTRRVSECFRPEIGKTHEEIVCPSLKASIAMEEPKMRHIQLLSNSKVQLHSHTEASVSVFVAVFSERSSGWRRNKVRSMWRRAREISGNAVTVRFVLCSHTANGEIPWTTHNVQVESELDDVEMVDCDDGDTTGGKTRKLVSIMGTYAEKYRNDFFMKIDDDTFIAWRRYAEQLATRGHPKMFMGVESKITEPCRDPNSHLYEPLWTFNGEVYPRSMSAAAGYTLGRDLVELILNTGLGRNKILFNEEGAIGMWMKLAMDWGHNVEFINIHGVDKYWEWDFRHPLTAFSTWGSYPHVAHAGLAADTIECLSTADEADAADRQIAECFETEVGKNYAGNACSSTEDHGDAALTSRALVTSQGDQEMNLLYASTEKASSQKEEDLRESVFVAVFSRRSATWRRDKIRAM
jgi:hypothetical protein